MTSCVKVNWVWRCIVVIWSYGGVIKGCGGGIEVRVLYGGVIREEL